MPKVYALGSAKTNKGLKMRYIYTYMYIIYTVEPLNNVTFGTSYSVHYREVSFLRRL